MTTLPLLDAIASNPLLDFALIALGIPGGDVRLLDGAGGVMEPDAFDGLTIVLNGMPTPPTRRLPSARKLKPRTMQGTAIDIIGRAIPTFVAPDAGFPGVVVHMNGLFQRERVLWVPMALDLAETLHVATLDRLIGDWATVVWSGQGEPDDATKTLIMAYGFSPAHTVADWSRVANMRIGLHGAERKLLANAQRLERALGTAGTEAGAARNDALSPELIARWLTSVRQSARDQLHLEAYRETRYNSILFVLPTIRRPEGTYNTVLAWVPGERRVQFGADMNWNPEIRDQGLNQLVKAAFEAGDAVTAIAAVTAALRQNGGAPYGIPMRADRVPLRTVEQLTETALVSCLARPNQNARPLPDEANRVFTNLREAVASTALVTEFLRARQHTVMVRRGFVDRIRAGLDDLAGDGRVAGPPQLDLRNEVQPTLVVRTNPLGDNGRWTIKVANRDHRSLYHVETPFGSIRLAPEDDRARVVMAANGGASLDLTPAYEPLLDLMAENQLPQAAQLLMSYVEAR